MLRYFKLLTLFAFVSTFYISNTQAQNLQSHQWKQRLVLLISDDTASADYKLQLKELQSDPSGMMERKLLVYEIQPQSYKSFKDIVWNSSAYYYQKYSRENKPYEVILIGLDGGIKAYQHAFFTLDDLYQTIDSMPMRQLELARKSNKE